jgi:hypothetical protein
MRCLAQSSHPCTSRLQLPPTDAVRLRCMDQIITCNLIRNQNVASKALSSPLSSPVSLVTPLVGHVTETQAFLQFQQRSVEIHFSLGSRLGSGETQVCSGCLIRSAISKADFIPVSRNAAKSASYRLCWCGRIFLVTTAAAAGPSGVSNIAAVSCRTLSTNFVIS